jgi:hypothetical protein
MFFTAFPITAYSFDFKNQSPTVVTNIFNRVRMRTEVLQNALAYYKYIIQPGDTPEIVAHKQYGDATLHWIICLVNNMTDPHFDFPLDDYSLEQMIVQKYGYNDISTAMSTIHHYDYETIYSLAEVNGPTTVTTETHPVSLSQYDYTTASLQNQVVNVPVTSAVALKANSADPASAVVANLSMQSQYKPFYVYDYEVSLNEDKRTIKMLKPVYISGIFAELGSILNG